MTVRSRCGNVPFMASGRVCRLWVESVMRKCHKIKWMYKEKEKKSRMEFDVVSLDEGFVEGVYAMK